MKANLFATAVVFRGMITEKSAIVYERTQVFQFDGFGRQSQDAVPFMGHTNEDIDRLFIAPHNFGFR
jgi:hypothetical protein